MEQKSVTAYLGLGTNMGNREDNLKRALGLLEQRLPVTQVSPLYDTEPVGDASQPPFLNMVCRVETRLEPVTLLALAQGIELKMGRVRGRRNAPRPIDIDILLFGDEVISTLELTVPHALMAERAFVLVPLADIAPDLVHPVLGKTIRGLLDTVGGKEGVIKWVSRMEF